MGVRDDLGEPLLEIQKRIPTSIYVVGGLLCTIGLLVLISGAWQAAFLFLGLGGAAVATVTILRRGLRRLVVYTGGVSVRTSKGARQASWAEIHSITRTLAVEALDGSHIGTTRVSINVTRGPSVTFRPRLVPAADVHNAYHVMFPLWQQAHRQDVDLAEHLTAV